MRKRYHRPPWFARCVFSSALFRSGTKQKVLYLTFDDGPDPRSTGKILKILLDHNVKAVFFCCGNAAEKYKELVAGIRADGHLIGNHTYSHCDGFRTTVKEYLAEIDKAAPFTSSILFRPPYGNLTPRQYIQIKKQYRIFFWDVMSYDFDNDLPAEESFAILRKKIRPGSVIVLHDTPGSSVSVYLDKFIRFATSEGYSFKIPPSSKQTS